MIMKRTLMLGGLSALMLMTGACSSTTSRADVRDARRDVREANAYGDREDRREARRALRETKRDYRDDHACGPEYGRAC
jgi:hypothetical protein